MRTPTVSLMPRLFSRLLIAASFVFRSILGLQLIVCPDLSNVTVRDMHLPNISVSATDSRWSTLASAGEKMQHVLLEKSEKQSEDVKILGPDRFIFRTRRREPTGCVYGLFVADQDLSKDRPIRVIRIRMPDVDDESWAREAYILKMVRLDWPR